MTSGNSGFSPDLVKTIQGLSSLQIFRTASALSNLVSHLDGESSLGKHALPTACAVFVLALEGELGSSLPSYRSFAESLAIQAGARKDLVVIRYRRIYKMLTDWVSEVPWLTGCDDPDNRLTKKKQKTTSRAVVAAGLKDVIQFREDIRVQKTLRERDTPISLTLDVGDEKEDILSEDDQDSIGPQKRKRSEESGSSHSFGSLRLLREHKKAVLDKIDIASLSLLSPNHPLVAKPSDSKTSHNTANKIMVSGIAEEPRLSRLQSLTKTRGGEYHISDTELFEEGELEDLFRPQEEVEQLKRVFGWTDSEPPFSLSAKAACRTPDWDPDGLSLWEGIDNAKDDEGPEAPMEGEQEEQVVGEWREPSPGYGEQPVADNDFDVYEEW